MSDTDAFDLSGLTVWVTAERRADDQAVMFGRLGAEVVQAPALQTVRLPDPSLLRRRTEELVADPPDYLIANTGIGIRTWLDAAADWGLADALTASLGASKIAARGPKAVGALSSAGLGVWWRSPGEQLSEVVDHLISEGLAGRKVAFQPHGDDGSDVLARLRHAGARVTSVPVYQWAPADPQPVVDLIGRCCSGEVQAVTFTAGPQVDAVMGRAREVGRAEDLRDRLNDSGTVVGCVGPVCASAAYGQGIEGVVVPPNWRLGSLVKAVARALSERHPRRR